MKITDPLTIPTEENTYIADLEPLVKKYGEKIVESAIEYLTYKKPIPELPKTSENNLPILYVFRHGQSEDNKNMIFSGWRDAKLTNEGVLNAEKIAEKLKNKNIQMVISSDQIRTIKTAEIALSKNDSAKKLDIIQDHRLRERHYGDWQGHSKLIIHLENPELLESVRRGWTTPPPNGESLEMVEKRVMELVMELIPKMKEFGINVAISCSGNSIRPIRKYFEGLTETESAELETPTGKDYAAYEIK